MYNMLIYLQ